MFPFDKIKIAESFRRHVEQDMAARSIIGANLATGRSLDMNVIAEGVETQELPRARWFAADQAHQS